MLRVRGLRKAYGDVPALRGVDLDVGRGRIVSLLGPNGAGKTTLVSIVAGLRRADAGSVRVGEVDALADPRGARAQIGLAPQELGVYPILSVRRNLQVFGELTGLRGAHLWRRIERTAVALGIEDLLDRVAGTLSGGQKRRVHTAVALLHRPPLLLLDEATVGADVETRGRVLRLVRDLAAEGVAVLYSTHYLHEVEELGAEVAIMDRGEIIAAGPVSDLVRAHARPAVELGFDGPVPPGVDDPRLGEEVEVGDGRVRIATDDPAATIARALEGLGERTAAVRSIEIIRASLEAAYLGLTGRRYEPTGADAEAARAPL